MCGIVGAIAERDVSRILLEGLRRLEYRGYDSAGMALLPAAGGHLTHLKTVGKVNKLSDSLMKSKIQGSLGIAHTRWATHGQVSLQNTHPHLSNNNEFAVVHNGVISNYKELKNTLIEAGYEFRSETDTEVIATYLQFLYFLGVFSSIF